jgi:ribosome biogenesis ATPase
MSRRQRRLLVLPLPYLRRLRHSWKPQTAAPSPETWKKYPRLPRQISASCDQRAARGATNAVASEKDYAPPTVRHLADLGGVGPCVETMLKLVTMPMYLEVYLHMVCSLPAASCCMDLPVVARPCLRTRLVACKLFNTPHGVNFNAPSIRMSVSAPSIVSGISGESEKTLRETFEGAKVRFTFWSSQLDS